MIIITGKAGSGKSTLLKKLRTNFNYNKPITSRPKREGENNEEYRFFSDQDCESLANLTKDVFIVAKFNNWWYLVPKSSQLKILNPQQITEELYQTHLIIYLDIPEEIRRERLLARNDADSVERRMKADFKDFKDFKLYHLRITENG